jgi:hypothetical protein
MAEKVISEYDTNMFFPTDNNTEINSTCVNNHNITFNENTPNDTNETALTSCIQWANFFQLPNIQLVQPGTGLISEENVRASLCLKTWYEADVIKIIRTIIKF